MSKQTPKQKAARMHNGLLGHTAMMRRNARTIIEAPTASEFAKEIAQKIEMMTFTLTAALKAKRIDP